MVPVTYEVWSDDPMPRVLLSTERRYRIENLAALADAHQVMVSPILPVYAVPHVSGFEASVLPLSAYLQPIQGPTLPDPEVPEVEAKPKRRKGR